MKFTDVEIPTVARGRMAEPNPFIDVVEPKVSTAKTPGVDDSTERTVTFWVEEPDGRGNHGQ